MGDFGDDAHECGNGEIDDMRKAWEAVLIRVEGVDLTGVKGRFDEFAGGVVVACVVGSDAEKL